MNYSKKKSSVIFPHTYCKAEYPEWLKSFRKDFVGNDFLDSRHNVKMFCCVALLDVNYICCNGIIMLCFVWCNLLIKNMFNVQSLYRLEIAVEQQTHVWLNVFRRVVKLFGHKNPFTPKFWTKKFLTIINSTRWQLLLGSSHLKVKIVEGFNPQILKWKPPCVYNITNDTIWKHCWVHVAFILTAER